MLIEIKRFEALGGIEDSDVRRILGNFVLDLPGHLFLLGKIKNKGTTKELSMALHKLKGTANSCGFVAIGRVAETWSNAPDLDEDLYLSDLAEVIHASIRAWHMLTEKPKLS